MKSKVLTVRYRTAYVIRMVDDIIKFTVKLLAHLVLMPKSQCNHELCVIRHCHHHHHHHCVWTVLSTHPIIEVFILYSYMSRKGELSKGVTRCEPVPVGLTIVSYIILATKGNATITK